MYVLGHVVYFGTAQKIFSSEAEEAVPNLVKLGPKSRSQSCPQTDGRTDTCPVLCIVLDRQKSRRYKMPEVLFV